MSNSPFDDPETLQSCPFPGCTGEAELNRDTDLVTCTRPKCLLWYSENGLTVEVWEEWPRECSFCHDSGWISDRDGGDHCHCKCGDVLKRAHDE